MDVFMTKDNAKDGNTEPFNFISSQVGFFLNSFQI